jgi:hypothetical protein
MALSACRLLPNESLSFLLGDLLSCRESRAGLLQFPTYSLFLEPFSIFFIFGSGSRQEHPQHFLQGLRIYTGMAAAQEAVIA